MPHRSVIPLVVAALFAVAAPSAAQREFFLSYSSLRLAPATRTNAIASDLGNRIWFATDVGAVGGPVRLVLFVRHVFIPLAWLLPLRGAPSLSFSLVHHNVGLSERGPLPDLVDSVGPAGETSARRGDLRRQAHQSTIWRRIARSHPGRSDGERLRHARTGRGAPDTGADGGGRRRVRSLHVRGLAWAGVLGA